MTHISLDFCADDWPAEIARLERFLAQPPKRWVATPRPKSVPLRPDVDLERWEEWFERWFV